MGVYPNTMGFALWIDEDCATAAGTHEYRPMGLAVVSVTSVITVRDFDHRRRLGVRRPPGFAGFFASLGEMNDYLRRRRSQPFKKKLPRRRGRYLPYI
jgi:hypothetical protein